MLCVKISSNLTWAILFTSQSHLWTSKHFSGEKKKREKSMFCTGLIQHLSGPKSVVSFICSGISPGTNSPTTQIPSPATTLLGIQNNLGSHQEFHAQRIPWLPTLPGSGTGTEQILGWGEKPGHCRAHRRGDWSRDGIVPNRARNSSGKTNHPEAWK